MQQLKLRGAPTTALDFLRPYSSSPMITDFIDAAESGASWGEAMDFLGLLHGLIDRSGTPINPRAVRILKQAKKFFGLAVRGKHRHRDSSG